MQATDAVRSVQVVAFVVCVGAVGNGQQMQMQNTTSIVSQAIKAMSYALKLHAGVMFAWRQQVQEQYTDSV